MLTYLGKLPHPLGAWLCIRTDGLACPPTPSPHPHGRESRTYAPSPRTRERGHGKTYMYACVSLEFNDLGGNT